MNIYEQKARKIVAAWELSNGVYDCPISVSNDLENRIAAAFETNCFKDEEPPRD